MQRLKDRRVLIVGASSGIGRAIATACARDGARVAVAARRADALEALAAELGGAEVVPMDVREEASCKAGVEKACDALGGLDALVYVVGIARLHEVSEVDAATWQELFAANVTGAAVATRAALPSLQASRGRALYISSISPDDFPPRRALGPYMVTKAALNKLVEVLQAENKRVSFGRVSVGDTAPTDFATTWDGDTIGRVVGEWQSQGVMFGRAMDPEAVGSHVADLLAARENVAVSRIVPHYAEEAD